MYHTFLSIPTPVVMGLAAPGLSGSGWRRWVAVVSSAQALHRPSSAAHATPPRTPAGTAVAMASPWPTPWSTSTNWCMMVYRPRRHTPTIPPCLVGF